MHKLKDATKQWTGSEGEFKNDFCIYARTHSLKQKEQNGIEGYIVGFSKDERVSFQTGEDICSKIISVKLENITILEN